MVRAVALQALFCLVVVPALLAAGPLFPTPLHLTRQVHDPISGKTTMLNEYGYGNRLISVRGGLTSIADYEKGELLEIDRDAGTYSITRFEAIAKATQALGPQAAAAVAETKKPMLRAVGSKATKSGRSAEFFESSIDAKPLKQKVEVGRSFRDPFERRARSSPRICLSRRAAQRARSGPLGRITNAGFVLPSHRASPLL